MNFISRYRKYSLIAIILLTGFIIFKEITPFMGGLLGALTIYVLVRGQMNFLVEQRKLKRALAASVILAETILFFLIPLTLIVLVVVDKAGDININPQQIIQPIAEFATNLEKKTGYELLKIENITGLINQIPRIGQTLMNGISSFFLNIIVLLFVLYFMLTGNHRMEKFVYDILPFSDNNKKEVLRESKLIVTSNAIGIPLLGIIQGFIAMAGYLVFGTPSPIFFGFLTCIATILPVIGTAIVWVPLVIYLAITGEWGSAIGLLAYGLFIITQIDNLIRFVLQKKMADIHPLITIFGVVIGFSLFGFMGVIFGPLLLSMFFLCFNIFKKEYLDKAPLN
ncbi:AI-2E family transporter [Bacteroides sp. 519]|uniref:AI-2E family transporter n=1 Tax=Bacteroides sp. 519 TaxID=2302937 RepID=UPI0013D83F42|nr:AI-2E family transporter [Bacteroides sp. 519]NDV59580.1 AI-2E family transporter [Bacteroides sp. 519]